MPPQSFLFPRVFSSVVVVLDIDDEGRHGQEQEGDGTSDVAVVRPDVGTESADEIGDESPSGGDAYRWHGQTDQEPDAPDAKRTPNGTIQLWDTCTWSATTLTDSAPTKFMVAA